MAEAAPDEEERQAQGMRAWYWRVEFWIALVLLSLIFVADRIGWLPTDWAADTLVPLYVHIGLETDRSEQFLFVDVDAKTLGRMGEPLITPRDALVKLLDFATEETVDGKRRAKAVVVDIALSHRTDGVGDWIVDSKVSKEDKADTQLSPPDQDLFDFFSRYDRDTPIVLARGFSLDVHDPENLDHERPEASFLDDHPNIMPLDWYEETGNEPAFSKGRIFWGSPLFERDTDRHIRRWHLWNSWCRDGRAGVIPSVHLLTLALAQKDLERTPHSERTNTLKAVAGRLRQIGEIRCGQSVEKTGTPATIPIGGVEIELKDKDDARRIIYTANPLGEEKWWLGLIGLGTGGGRVVTIPAHLILYPPSAAPGIAPIDLSVLDDRIVVVGASHAQARDEYVTPIGTMPGATIIVNAIQSLAMFGTLAVAPFLAQLVYSLVVMAALVWLHCRFGSEFASLIASIVLLLITFFFNFWLLGKGVWLSSAILWMFAAIFGQIFMYADAIRSSWRGIREFLRCRNGKLGQNRDSTASELPE